MVKYVTNNGNIGYKMSVENSRNDESAMVRINSILMRTVLVFSKHGSSQTQDPETRKHKGSDQEKDRMIHEISQIPDAVESLFGNIKETGADQAD